jgi:hypothetical protein
MIGPGCQPNLFHFRIGEFRRLAGGNPAFADWGCLRNQGGSSLKASLEEYPMPIPVHAAFRPARFFALTLGVLCSGVQAQAPKEQTLLSLKNAKATEVQSQGFSLPKDMKVHVYAKGGGVEQGTFFAYGWILNAATREVVWQMDGRSAKQNGLYQVADAYLDLPKGSYEAYYSHHAFGRNSGIFGSWTRNLDRRSKNVEDRSHGRWLHRMFSGGPEGTGTWERRVGNYGMEIYAAAADAASVQTFQAPLTWKNEFISLIPNRDGSRWNESFRVRKPVTIHVYAQGESVGDDDFADYGWILDAHTRRPVWEMNQAKALYGGGARKNYRQVETIQLPAGDYIASYLADDSHSPADWNAAPPCDPLRYGLVLSLPKEGDRALVELVPAPAEGPVLAQLIRMENHRNERASFTLNAQGKVRIYALGETDDDEFADLAWIEDEQGKTVWTMTQKNTQHAGGAAKNRMADEVISLPKGTYTLRYRSDGSHAHGRWNDTAPWDGEHYGVTVYPSK